MATNPVRSSFTFTIADFYKEYKSKLKKEGLRVPQMPLFKTYRGIVLDFLIEMFKKVIYENFVFMMPYSLGSILVKARKTNPKEAKVDFNMTKKLGKIVKHLNTHTFGYYFYIKWDKSYVRFKNNFYYKFEPTRTPKSTALGVGKRALSHHIRKISKDSKLKSYIKI